MIVNRKHTQTANDVVNSFPEHMQDDIGGALLAILNLRDRVLAICEREKKRSEFFAFTYAKLMQSDNYDLIDMLACQLASYITQGTSVAWDNEIHQMLHFTIASFPALLHRGIFVATQWPERN